MAEAAFVYDAIRTPRSKGKPDGTLNEQKLDKSIVSLERYLEKERELSRLRQNPHRNR